MANNILSGIFGKSSFSLTDISDFSQAGTNLKVVKVTIRWRSTVMRHQRENGSTVVDVRIVRAADIDVAVICPDANSLAATNDLLLSRNTMFQLYSKGITIPNVMVDEEQITQAPENLSSTPLFIRFKQIIIGGFDPIIFSQPTDASLVDRGLALLDDAKDTATDLYGRVSNKISGLF